MPTLHIFSGEFESREEATLYSERQWPHSEDSWPSDAEEDNDSEPTWKMQDDLGGAYMDSDFIETIDGADRMEYLETQLANQEDFARLEAEIPHSHNILVLIMSSALDGGKVKLSSTPKLTYHGEFRWNLG